MTVEMAAPLAASGDQAAVLSRATCSPTLLAMIARAMAGSPSFTCSGGPVLKEPNPGNHQRDGSLDPYHSFNGDWGNSVRQGVARQERMETTQSRSAANDPIYRKYQRIAPLYDLIDSPLERAWKGNLRPLLFKNLSGHVLDAGAGTGLNAPHYPDGVRVTGMDISPAMLAKATKRARKLGKDASYRAMDLFQLSFPSETFDHAVAAFLFCNLPPERQLAALQQVQRVIKPGGHLRLIDYRMVEGGVGKLAMRLRTPWLRLIFGATFDPKTESHIEEAGLELVEQRILMGGKIQFLDMRRPETG